MKFCYLPKGEVHKFLLVLDLEIFVQYKGRKKIYFMKNTYSNNLPLNIMTTFQ